jgi:opacity protein-like surface antigen
MKKHLLATACLATILVMLPTFLSAQSDDNHKYEFGLRFSGINFSGFNSFSAIYKKRLDNGKFRRISGTFGGLIYSKNADKSTFGFNAGLSIGNEKRREMGKKTSFYSGPVFSISTSFAKTEEIKPSWNLEPSLGAVIGLQYDFSDNWAINLETIPSASVALRKQPGSDIATNASVGFSSNVVLSILHKF